MSNSVTPAAGHPYIRNKRTRAKPPKYAPPAKIPGYIPIRLCSGCSHATPEKKHLRCKLDCGGKVSARCLGCDAWEPKRKQAAEPTDDLLSRAARKTPQARGQVPGVAHQQSPEEVAVGQVVRDRQAIREKSARDREAARGSR